MCLAYKASSWFLRPFVLHKGTRLPGETADSRAGAEAPQDGPGGCLLAPEREVPEEQVRDVTEPQKELQPPELNQMNKK